MRYICTLLEADIVGHLTLRLMMKVSRFRSEIGLPHNSAELSCLTLIDTVLTGTTFACILYSSR
ncbi:hypothetical protein Xmir_02971 [Xenorhabdus miraniensis]|uniref:Uncharacterized protein n=1 Tax=Xenorhabdus miraniensis TaxID=351674 RepID=A0A2D0JMY0_9GAMM|nr:hypothetical protein [Xenorhabdus miraniensis]PHM47644.1 hypothetical protein Xmir_02971 [Xenorhabdus miraniensis]